MRADAAYDHVRLDVRHDHGLASHPFPHWAQVLDREGVLEVVAPLFGELRLDLRFAGALDDVPWRGSVDVTQEAIALDEVWCRRS